MGIGFNNGMWKFFCSPGKLNKHLFEAAKKGQMERVKKSIDMGADLNATDDHKKTPMFYAVSNNFKEIENYLSSKGAVITVKERKKAMTERWNRPGMKRTKEGPGTRFEMPLPKGDKPSALNQLLRIHSRQKKRLNSIKLIEDFFRKSMEKELESGDPVARKKLERIFRKLLVYYNYNTFETTHEVNPEAGYMMGNGEVSLLGLLGMTEATGLELNSDLVILSSCESTGEHGEGCEGFAGMPRSFLFAGSQAVVASHWKVDSRETKMLIGNYGKHLKTKGRLEALEAARVDVKNTVVGYNHGKKIRVSYAHPYFWASFVLLGER